MSDCHSDSASDSEYPDSDREGTPVPPPIKKLKQKKLSFGPATAGPSTTAISSSGSADTDPDCHRTDTRSQPCTSDCCKGSLTPYQPTEASKLQGLQRRQGKRNRRFSPTWYSTYPWLTVCTTKGKAFCVYCRYCSEKGLFHLAKKGEDAFVEVGFDNWKKAHEKFNQHSHSDLHKEALLKVELSQQEDIRSLMSTQAMAEQKCRQQMLLKQLSSLKYLL